MDFEHVDIDDFAPRGIKALRESWSHTCSRCACCGKDDSDEATALTYGHDEQRAPNGTRAMCGCCREYIDTYLRENVPQKMCGRGTAVSALQEWTEVLRLGHEIGNGELKTKGWVAESLPSLAGVERKKAKEFFPSEGNFEMGSDGVMRKKLTTEEKAEVAWKEKKR
jgi:hypothetical protein